MTLKKVEGVFEIQFACKLLKWYAPWNAESNIRITFNFIAAYVHEKIYTLLSVLSILSVFSMNLI